MAGEQLVLDILSKHGGSMTSGELYEKYNRACPQSDRQVRNYVEALERRKLVAAEEAQAAGGRGKTRVIRLV